MRQKTTCSFCSSCAVGRVRGSRLCRSHLRQLAKIAHVKIPSNPRRKKLTRRKARTILHHGEIGGRLLTAKQQRYFGARASGYPPKRPRKNPKRRVLMAPTKQGYYLVERKGRSITKIIGGPFQTAEQASRILRRRFRSNPRHKLGHALELRYYRNVGRHRGFYKHVFTTKPDVIGLDSGNVLLRER